MKIERDGTSSGVEVIHLNGDFDLDNSPPVKEAIQSVAAAKKNVVIDMAEVNYIDSSGISLLISTHKSFLENGRKLALSGVTRKCMRTFRFVLLNEVFTFYPSADLAKAALIGPSEENVAI